MDYEYPSGKIQAFPTEPLSDGVIFNASIKLNATDSTLGLFTPS
jgi:hypothetical protein